MPTPTICGSDDVSVDVEMLCELSQELPTSPFVATLWRVEKRWFDEDTQPDVVETQVSEAEFASSMPAVFASVQDWLVSRYRLLVAPSSWNPGQTGPGTGMVVFLSGRATPCH
ncbi:MAG: hypothetical protein PHQ28_02925 [Mycobacterium sp.]|nr:hypothetical protein [Mycobacterium sp.]